MLREMNKKNLPSITQKSVTELESRSLSVSHCKKPSLPPVIPGLLSYESLWEQEEQRLPTFLNMYFSQISQMFLNILKTF